MRPALSLVLGSTLLGSCTADDFIARDYVVYDLGGSNQTLLGAKGSIMVENVTAVRLEEPRIFVEADGRYDNARHIWQPCSYHMIDMQRAQKVSPKIGSYESLLYAAKIADGAKLIMDRSCAAKAAKRAAGQA